MKYLISAFAVFVFFACGTTHQVELPKSGADRDSSAMYEVKGKVVSSSDYCGGIAPSPEMRKQLKTPNPFASATLYIKNAGGEALAQQSVITTVHTNEQGEFSVRLPSGNYAVVTEAKTRSYNYPNLPPSAKPNAELCQKWLNTADFYLKVPDDKDKLPTYKMHLSCNNCVPKAN